jgi:hypothetical protein
MADDLINSVNFNLNTNGVQNVFTGDLVKKTRLPYNEKSAFYTNRDTTSLTEDTTV